ncbi:MAG: putative peptidoglycan binding domain [Acidobacteriota bacterium]|nr:putative peptidoglycan binding domain [Acidobacteriota bacterium]
MRKLVLSAFALTLFTCVAHAQNTNSSTATKQANTNARPARKHTPVFRANKDQIKQAQTMLKQRTFYTGDATGRLDDATREGLKKYQQAEGLKVTGTLNASTLEKMHIQLTDKQKETWKQIQAAQTSAKPK